MSNLWTLTQAHFSEEILIPGDTVPKMFWNAVAKRGDKIWMRQKEFGIWRSWTWNQAAATVREIGGGLLSLGLKPGDCAAILSNTVVEWVLCDLAI
jgi:long-chain acyl-CoA synthetase